MRPAFTIIEVIAAAAIAALAGVALLQMNSQSLFLFEKVRDTALSGELSALAGNHADVRFHHTSKTLYDLFGDSYAIDNDELRKKLQNEKFDYSETLIDTILIDAGGMQAEANATWTDEEMEAAQVAPMLQLELIQVTLKNSDRHGGIIIARQK